MNIFFLDWDVNKCAKDHCDKHVVKMILETAQLLLGIKTATGFSSNADELKVSYEIFYSMVINPMQQEIMKQIQGIIEFNGYDASDLYFVPLIPFGFLAETRGQGGFTITAPSGGTVYLADLAPAGELGPEYASLRGPAGEAATLAIGTTTSVSNSGTASVTNVGTNTNGTLNFVLRDGPTGPQGIQGIQGVQGNTGTFAVGTTTSVANSGTASVTNVGSSTAGTFDFVLRDGPTGPTGPQGPTATLAVGAVSSVTNSGTASVTNVGSSSAGTFDFVLRDGPTGPQGATGTAATITIGTIGTVAYPGPGTVTNSGTTGAAVLDFILVTGPQGAIGDLTAADPIAYVGSQFSLKYGAGLGTATGGTLVADFSDATPQALATAGSAGTSTELSRGDHAHARPSASDVGAIANALVDAKGDLITATANDTPARLAVGSTNGHVLTVDSSTSTGLAWKAAASGSDIDPLFLAGV